MKYNIIYADPCWPYPPRKNKNTRFGGGVHGQYSTMTEKELCQMAGWVDSIAEKNCALLMWATGPRTDMAIRVGTAWGFKFATAKAFSWVKVAKTIKLPVDITLHKGSEIVVVPAGTRVPFQLLSERVALGLSSIVGPGNYSGSNSEDVLLFMRGSLPRVEKLVPQIVLNPRMKPHSKKPTEVRDRIVRMFGDVPRVEIFARVQAPGWDANGLELDGTDYRQPNSIAGTSNIVPIAA